MDSVYPNLSYKLNEKGITTSFLAKKLNIPEDLVCSKLLGYCDWKLYEVVVICCLLNTSDVKLLFVQL